MALKQVILSRKLAGKRSELDAKKSRRAELQQQRAAMQTRETELEQAVQEITEETEEAVRAEVEAAVSEFEAEVAQVEADIAETDQEIAALETEVADLAAELEELAAKVEGEDEPDAEPEPSEDDAADEGRSKRKGRRPMNTRTMFGTTRQRTALFARADVKEFAQRVRQIGKEKRAVKGGELTIPEVLLPMIREQVEENSKLLRYVNLQTIRGTARQTVMGTIPEAVWTEMCAKLNELTLSFNDAEVDGYKVGGYIPVCNALLEDNDVNLVSQILFALARAIAIAVDKAIVYGTGTKMPLGIVTRLAQTGKPSGYPTTAREWENLSKTNITSITAANSTGIKLFQSLIGAFGAAKKKYGAGGKFWAMNEATHMKLVSEALNINATGAIVTGINETMPVIGGDIVELDFLPDNVIIAGYGELYLMVERAGIEMNSSEHYLFVEDKTVFKATARYDGLPVIAEGFVAIGINGATVSATAVTFTEDAANKADDSE